MHRHVLIIGGGLSGLHTAYELNKRGIDFILVEARDRFGGRILSRNGDAGPYRSTEPGVDLGPSWFWPGQRRMERLVSELGLGESVFMQYAEGDSVYETTTDTQRGNLGITMRGSYRLRAGMRQLVAALESEISASQLVRNASAKRLSRRDDKICVEVVVEGEEQTIGCDAAVIAMPPRLVIEVLEFDPPLTGARATELQSIPTWMAGHAKLVALYDEPFWRGEGFSGDAISRRGPLAEVHDASAKEGAPYALFGFVSVPASQRNIDPGQLERDAIDQLVRLFGDRAANPISVSIKDWAIDERTASSLDQEMQSVHGLMPIDAHTDSNWGVGIIFSGSETANSGDNNNGYLEGALEASERAIELIETKVGHTE